MLIVSQYGHMEMLEDWQFLLLLDMLEDGATDDQVNVQLEAWGCEPIPPDPPKPQYKPKKEEVWLG